MTHPPKGAFYKGGTMTREVDNFRLSNRSDFIEDLYWAIRELMELHGVGSREIRRYVNQAINGEAPAPIREAVLPLTNGTTIAPNTVAGEA